MSNTFVFYADNSNMIDVYWNIFNAIAAIIKNQSYLDLLKLTFLIGGFIAYGLAVAKTASEKNPSSLKYFAGYIFTVTILLILFLGKTSDVVLLKKPSKQPYCDAVSIPIGEHKTAGAVVSGVPQLLAFIFTSANSVGYEMEKKFKSAFRELPNTVNAISPVDDILGIKKILEYSGNKLFIPVRIDGEERNMKLTDLFGTILTQCVIIPASSDYQSGPTIISTFEKTGNPNRTLIDFVKNGNLNFYKNPTAPAEPVLNNVRLNGNTVPSQKIATLFGTTYTCGHLINEYEQGVQNILNSGAISCDSELLDTMNDSTIRLLTGGSVVPNRAIAEQIALNTGLLTQVMSSKRNVSIGDIPYTAGYTIAETAVKNYGQGIFLMNVLPYVQAGLRAIIYAFFPFVFVMVILPGGLKVLASYIKTIIWVELWTPLMIIMGMFLSFASAQKFNEFYNEQGFNVFNGFQVFSDTLAYAGVAGYLYAMIPGIAWFIINGTMDLVGRLTTRMAVRFKTNLIGDDIATGTSYAKTVYGDEGATSENIDKAIVRQTVANRAAIAFTMMDMAGNEKSFSQISYEQSRFHGREEAGSFLAIKKAGLDNVEKAQMGKTIKNIASGMGTANAIDNAEDFLENVATTKAVQTAIKRETGKVLTEFDEKQNNSIAKAQAAIGVADMDTKTKLAKEFGIKRLSDAKSYEETVSAVSDATVAENISFEKAVAGSVGKEGEKIFGQTGFFKGMHEDVENVMHASESAGKQQAAKMEAVANVLDAKGYDDIERSKEITLFTGIGAAQSIGKKLRLQAQTSHVTFEGIAKTAKKLTPLGAKGNIFDRMQSDATSDNAGFFELSPQKMARLDLLNSTKTSDAINAYIRSDKDIHNDFEYGVIGGKRVGTTMARREAVDYFRTSFFESPNKSQLEDRKKGKKPIFLMDDAFTAKHFGEGKGIADIQKLASYDALNHIFGDKAASIVYWGAVSHALGDNLFTQIYMNKKITKKASKLAEEMKKGKAISKVLGYGSSALLKIPKGIEWVLDKTLKTGAIAVIGTGAYVMIKNKEFIQKLMEDADYQNYVAAIAAGKMDEAKKIYKELRRKYGTEIDQLEHDLASSFIESQVQWQAFDVGASMLLTRSVAAGSVGTLAAAALVYKINKNMEENLQHREVAFGSLRHARIVRKAFEEGMKNPNQKIVSLEVYDGFTLEFNKETGKWALVDRKLGDVNEISDKAALKLVDFIIDTSQTRFQKSNGFLGYGEEMQKLKEFVEDYRAQRREGFDQAVVAIHIEDDLLSVVDK